MRWLHDHDILYIMYFPLNTPFIRIFSPMLNLLGYRRWIKIWDERPPSAPEPSCSARVIEWRARSVDPTCYPSSPFRKAGRHGTPWFPRPVPVGRKLACVYSTVPTRQRQNHSTAGQDYVCSVNGSRRRQNRGQTKSRGCHVSRHVKRASVAPRGSFALAELGTWGMPGSRSWASGWAVLQLAAYRLFFDSPDRAPQWHGVAGSFTAFSTALAPRSFPPTGPLSTHEFAVLSARRRPARGDKKLPLPTSRFILI